MMIDEEMIEANIHKHENCKMLKIFKEYIFFCFNLRRCGKK